MVVVRSLENDPHLDAEFKSLSIFFFFQNNIWDTHQNPISTDGGSL